MSPRNVEFRLRNKANKKVTGYGLGLNKLGHPCCEVNVGAPLVIGAEGTSGQPQKVTYSAYSYYCEGESKMYLIIDILDFADGTTWKVRNAPKSR